jgi:hypothetical protein
MISVPNILSQNLLLIPNPVIKHTEGSYYKFMESESTEMYTCVSQSGSHDPAGHHEFFV